ncbi:DUF6318 family protein [Sporichthya sp.]|uniref:DUF6318 family protein n=1 Tax=Sporichthya sp. TaxID=65475 RepID=UPI0018227E8C|nr:DUF6318 family protein [Sporichthya sp.]MBA3745601.1 hypothetical protein [Sporichthya sp.]
MSTKSFALRAAALSAAALLALSACGGGDKDDPLGGPENTPAGGGIGGSVTIPDAATKLTDAGSEAFAKYYMESVLNNSYSTGNISTLIKYSHPQCIVCRATVGDIASAWARGKVDGGQVSISDLKASKANDNLYNVEFKYSKTRYVEVDGSGKTLFSSPAQNGLNILLQLQWNADAKAWQAREIVNQALRGGKAATATPAPTP